MTTAGIMTDYCQQLEAENKRLRAELDRLRAELDFADIARDIITRHAGGAPLEDAHAADD